MGEISCVGIEGLLHAPDPAQPLRCGCIQRTHTCRYFAYKAVCFNGESQGPLNHILLRSIWSEETPSSRTCDHSHSQIPRKHHLFLVRQWGWQTEGLSHAPCLLLPEYSALLLLLALALTLTFRREGMTVYCCWCLKKNLWVELFEKADHRASYLLCLALSISFCFLTYWKREREREKKGFHSKIVCIFKESAF